MAWRGRKRCSGPSRAPRKCNVISKHCSSAGLQRLRLVVALPRKELHPSSRAAGEGGAGLLLRNRKHLRGS